MTKLLKPFVGFGQPVLPLTLPEKIRFVLTALAILAAAYTAVAFNGTSDPFVAFFMPLLVLAMGLLLWPGIRQGWRVPWSRAVLALTLFYLYLAASTLWSSVPYISHLFLLLLGCVPLLFFGLTMARNPARACAAALCGMGLAWLGLAGYAMAQFFILPATAGHRIAAPMLDPNNLAAFFNLGVIVAAAWFIAERNTARNAVAYAVFALLLAATFATMSRAGLVIILLSMVALTIFERRNLRKRLWKLAALAGTAAMLFIAINMFSRDWFTTSFTELSHPAHSPSVRDRHALLAGSLNMLVHHPFGDIGLGNFYYYYPAFRPLTDMSDGFFAHSDPLQLALETGLPVLVFFYGFVLTVILRSIRAWRLAGDGTVRTIIAATSVALCSIILHAHINYNLYMPGILIPTAILLATWYVATEHAGADARRAIMLQRPVRRIAYGVLTLAIILGVAWPVRIGVTSYLLNKTSALAGQGQHDKAKHLADLLMRYGDAANFSIEEMRTRLTLDDYNAARDEPEPQRAAILTRGLGYIQHARAENPAFTVFMSLEAQYYFLGNDFAFPGGLAKAQAMLEHAVPLNPLDVDSREGLAVVYQAQNRNQDALAVMQQGANWPRQKGMPDVNFYLTLAHAFRLTGDEANAVNATNYAVERAKSYGITINTGP